MEEKKKFSYQKEYRFPPLDAPTPLGAPPILEEPPATIVMNTGAGWLDTATYTISTANATSSNDNS